MNSLSSGKIENEIDMITHLTIRHQNMYLVTKLAPFGRLANEEIESICSIQTAVIMVAKILLSSKMKMLKFHNCRYGYIPKSWQYRQKVFA